MKTQFSSFLCSDIVTRCHLHLEVFFINVSERTAGKKIQTSFFQNCNKVLVQKQVHLQTDTSGTVGVHASRQDFLNGHSFSHFFSVC